jgi:SAM-dependent methyltransferase
VTSSQPDPAKDHGARFGERAALYAAFRPGYPGDIFDRLVAHLRGPRNIAVDLGAGSGQATQDLARRFVQVVAVEPDARMAVLIPQADNISVRNIAAEAAEFPAQSVDAVISATAFHWMDQARVCAAAARWLPPGGVFFPFLYGPFRMEGAAAETFRRHAALWGPYKDARLGANVDYGKSIRTGGAFEIAETIGREMRFSLTPAAAAGFILTMSYASAYARAQGGLDAYRQRLETEFGAVSGDIVAAAHLGGVIARRKSD